VLQAIEDELTQVADEPNARRARLARFSVLMIVFGTTITGEEPAA
jgi:hypothetical protein